MVTLVSAGCRQMATEKTKKTSGLKLKAFICVNLNNLWAMTESVTESGTESGTLLLKLREEKKSNGKPYKMKH